MFHYQKIVKKNGKIIKLPYIQRLAKKGPNSLYRYRIIKKGKEAYIAYIQRVRHGFDLNRIRKVPKCTENYGKYPHHPIRKMEDFDLLPEQLLSYFTKNKNGKQLGIDKPERVLYIEKRIKNHGTKPASQIRRERGRKISRYDANNLGYIRLLTSYCCIQTI